MSDLYNWVQCVKHINIASLTTTIPTLCVWTALFIKIMLQEQRDLFFSILLICLLMIISQVSSIIGYQLDYTFNNKSLNDDLNNIYAASQLIEASFFIASVSFNAGHWFFAYSYLVLSFQIELITNEMRADTYSRQLNFLNAIVIIFIVVVPAIAWIYDIRQKYGVSDVMFDFEQLSLILSCIVLAWALRRLVRLVQFDSDLLANKGVIMWHLLVYLLVIVVNIVQTCCVAYDDSGYVADEVSTIAVLVVLCLCYLIFAWIINTIVTKILNAATHESIVTEQLSVERLDQGNNVNTFSTAEVERVSIVPRYAGVGDGIIATLFTQPEH